MRLFFGLYFLGGLTGFLLQSLRALETNNLAQGASGGRSCALLFVALALNKGFPRQSRPLAIAPNTKVYKQIKALSHNLSYQFKNSY